MPDTLRKKKKHQQLGSLLLRKGVLVAARRSNVGVPYSSVEQGAPLTPVPTWKLYENPSYKSLAVAAAGAVASITGLMDREDDDEEENSEEEQEEKKTWVQRDDVDSKDTATGSAPRIPLLSARKLAASLWEELQEDGQVTICDFSESSPRCHLQRRSSSLSTSESPDSVKHHHSSKAPTMSQQISRSSQPLPSLSPPLKAIMLMQPSAAGIISRLQSSASKPCQISSPGKGAREELGELVNKYEHAHITSPCDYIKTSSRSQALERTQSDTSCVESPFSEELKRALSKVQQVEAAQISARKEVDGLLRRCADEIVMLRTKEQEKIQAAVLSIAEQLDKEKKAKRNVEMENRRLASSLADANKAVLEAKEELEKERKARQLMEDVCDELAKEIGEDKTEAEELKRELAKVRDEIEEERKTLQVTEAWREERVQMKLSEAKLELEERCIALDELKLELELFLKQGKAHGVEAFLDRGGDTLRGVVKKLQEETSESEFFLKYAKGIFSPGNYATSSDIMCPRKTSRSSNEDRSIMHVNANDSNGIQQTLHSAEHGQNGFGWNVESDRLARVECKWLLSPNAHLDEHDKQWISCMQASRRSETGIKSYGSKARGLNSLDDRGLADSFNNLERRSRSGSDASSRSEEDCSSEFGFSNEEEGNWSADFDNENGHLRQRDIALRSASEVEEESGWRFSPKFSRKVTNRPLKIMNVERRHGAARVKQRHGVKGPTRARQCYDGDTRPKSVFSQTKQLTEDDNGFSSLPGNSPVYKVHMPSPDLLAQKGMNWNECSALLGRKAVYNSVDWSKPYKRNSLQAKLLLEDRLSRGNFKLMH